MTNMKHRQRIRQRKRRKERGESLTSRVMIAKSPSTLKEKPYTPFSPASNNLAGPCLPFTIQTGSSPVTNAPAYPDTAENGTISFRAGTGRFDPLRRGVDTGTWCTRVLTNRRASRGKGRGESFEVERDTGGTSAANASYKTIVPFAVHTRRCSFSSATGSDSPIVTSWMRSMARSSTSIDSGMGAGVESGESDTTDGRMDTA